MAELRRRLVHTLGAAVPLAWLVAGVPWPWIEAALVGGLLLGGALECVRLGGAADWAVFDALIREYERDNPAGYFLYVVGFAVTGLAFPPTVAAPAMLMLAFGDPLSGLLHQGGLGRKAPRVMGATFALCLVLAVTAGVPALAAVLGALAATAADALKPVVRGHVVDDNLTIPIAAAVAMWAGVALA